MTYMLHMYVSFLKFCIIFIYYKDNNMVRMRKLHEGQDDDGCEDNFYKGDYHDMGHIISLMN
jgi:hypothetical protein